MFDGRWRIILKNAQKRHKKTRVGSAWPQEKWLFPSWEHSEITALSFRNHLEKLRKSRQLLEEIT
jgi:hypothetical protein